MGKKQDKKDLPRGLQIDTTTGEGANITEEEIMVPKKKPVKAALGLALGVAGAAGAKKLFKKKKKIASVLSPVSNLLDDDKDESQKETGNAKMMNAGGEVTVGKGGDYIKDLID